MPACSLLRFDYDYDYGAYDDDDDGSREGTTRTRQEKYSVQCIRILKAIWGDNYFFLGLLN